MYIQSIYDAIHLSLQGGKDMPADTRKTRPRKDSQLIIRINGAERDAFVSLCEAMDTTAAREIRGFIREFTLSHQDAVEQPGASRKPNEKEPETWPKKRKSKTSKKK
jgi:hypothetical protein